MPEANLETWGDRKVLTATFDSLGGANLAVNKLEELEKKDLLDLDNTITVSKNAWDKLDVKQTTGDSGKKGAGVGALVGAVAGLIFPPSLLATTALGGAIGGMVGTMRGSYFDDSYVKAMGEALQPGQSMLIAIVDPHGRLRSRQHSMGWRRRFAGHHCPRRQRMPWRSMPRADSRDLPREHGTPCDSAAPLTVGTLSDAARAPMPATLTG